MIPTIIDFGPFGIHSFGLMMVLAFLAAWRRLYLSLSFAGENPSIAEDMIFWAAIGGIVGARLGFLLSFPQQLMEDPITAVFSGAGFVFHWGFVFGLLSLWILSKLRNFDFVHYSDLAAPALALGYAIGRIGCQLSGDGDYGIETSLPWAMGYPNGVIPTLGGILVHPTPVYETISCLCIAWILVRVTNLNIFQGKGNIFALFLMLMAAERFLIELIRIEPVIWLGLTQAQIVSALFFTVGTARLVTKPKVG
jgi:phosphatidylglycerol:prolipoprotein diacylglycerol transferase